MICNVFRPKRRINGRLHVGRLYRGRYKLDGEFRMTTVPLCTTDKQQAQQKLLALVRQREKELAGLTGRKPLREAAQSPLLNHLSDFLGDLRARKRSESHIKHVETRIKRLFIECRWDYLRDVSADSFQLWRANQKEFSQKTLHEYQSAASSMFVWMERNDRLESNPLRRVGKVERKGHEKVKRRSFTNDEMRRLLAVAGLYALGYLAAVNTGLRRKELRSVQWGDVHLEAIRPYILVRSATTKNHNAGKIYLKSQLAQMLADIKPAAVAADEPVFADRIASMRKMHEHLEAAKITACNEQGCKVDFHALRGTYNTNLELAGGSLQVRQELLRHSDPRLTAGTYMDTTRLETASLIEKLPDFVDDTQLDTHAIGASGRSVAQAVIASWGNGIVNAVANIDESPNLSQAVAVGHCVLINADSRFESPSLRHNLIREFSPQAAVLVVGAELNSANRFHGFMNSTTNDFSAI
jgi:integrase